MSGWFGPKLPVNAEQKAWADSRFGWLIQQFGRERLRAAQVILPTPEFFPDPFAGTEADVPPMLRRICSYMGVDAARVELYFYRDDGPDLGPGFHLAGERDRAAGLYHGGEIARIGIELSNLQDPLCLAATLAHELAHVLLLGGGRISADEDDHEPVTDLLTIFCGMGIFGANSSVRDSNWHSAGWSGWRVSRLGYLSQSMWSYALARFAHERGELDPRWQRQLRPDIRALFRRSLRVLSGSKR